MIFEEFTCHVTEQVRLSLPPRFEEAEFQIRKIHKLNDSYIGLVVRDENHPMTPAIKLDPFYREYINGRSFEDILKEIRDTIVHLSIPLDGDRFSQKLLSYEEARPRLFVRVCNREYNQDLLKSMPHHVVMDLALTNHISLGNSKNHRASINVNNEMMRYWKMTAEELNRDAMNNSIQLMPPVIEPLKTLLENCPDAEEYDNPFYVVKCKGYQSAAALFYPGVQNQLWELAGGNYYILPSSIHEVLMLPEWEGISEEFLKEMVRSINESCVGNRDKLSDNIYYYDQEKDELTMIK